MVRNETESRRRGPVDMFYFYLTFTGFFTAVSGVVVSSVFWALLGLGLIVWGLAYFGHKAF